MNIKQKKLRTMSFILIGTSPFVPLAITNNENSKSLFSNLSFQNHYESEDFKNTNGKSNFFVSTNGYESINTTNFTINKKSICEGVDSSSFSFDVINPQTFKFETMDEWVYYGKLLNNGLVRDLFFNINWNSDINNKYTNQTYSFLVDPTVDISTYNFSDCDKFENFSIINHETKNGSSINGYITQNKISLYFKVNGIQTSKFNFADYLQVMYDTKTKQIKTRINVNSSIPSMDPMIEVGISTITQTKKLINASNVSDYQCGIINSNYLYNALPNVAYPFTSLSSSTDVLEINSPFLIIKSSN